jgi:hypothetical protein
MRPAKGPSVPAKALLCRREGLQKGWGALASFQLYTILDPAGIPGHPYESTVAESTIRDAGYVPVEQQEQP